MHSAVFIIPAAYRDAGNALGEAMGWGPGNYSVALSPTGAEPATHYGCRADVTDGFLAMLADPPPEAAPVLAVLHVNIADTDDAYGHWSDVLATQNLMIVEKE